MERMALSGAHVFETLKRQVVMEKIVSTISTQFLQLGDDEIHVLIDKALEKIGKHSGVDRCYTYLTRESDGYMINTNEWIADGLEPLIHVQNAQNIEDFAWVHHELINFRVVHIPDVAELEENGLKQALTSMNIQSTLSVPMHYGQQMVGFIGFDSLRNTDQWTDNDIRLLKVIGEIFVGAIIRQRKEKGLTEANEQLEKLNNELEQRVIDRTNEILAQNEKIKDYAYYNAHLFRGPLTNVLGLIDLMKNDIPKGLEMEELMRHLEDSTHILDDRIREINELLE